MFTLPAENGNVGRGLECGRLDSTAAGKDLDFNAPRLWRAAQRHTRSRWEDRRDLHVATGGCWWRISAYRPVYVELDESSLAGACNLEACKEYVQALVYDI